jgi:transposase
MPQLRQDERDRALGMYQAGTSQRRFAAVFGVHCSTIARLIQRYHTTGSTRDRPRPGQPRVTTARQDRSINFRHLRDRFLTAAETARTTIGQRGRPIHRRTVSRRLRQHGIHCRRPYQGNILTQPHRAARRQWAGQLLQRGARFWTNVIFSDESRFNISNADGRERVYRRRNERYVQCNVRERNRFGGAA